MSSKAESEFTQVLNSWHAKWGVFSNCHGSGWEMQKEPESSPKLPQHIFSVTLKKYCLYPLLLLEKGLPPFTSPHIVTVSGLLKFTTETDVWPSEKCFILPCVWKYVWRLWQMPFHFCYEMLSLTMWCCLLFIYSFSLFFTPIHLIIYPQARSCSPQSHSLNNYLGRTFIIELYGRRRLRKNESWCVNNILWGFSEHYFLLSFSWEAKEQQSQLPLYFVTAGIRG